MVHSPNAFKEAGNQELSSDLPHGWKELNDLNHHCCLLKAALVGSWNQEPEPGIKTQVLHVGHGHPNQQFNF